MTKSLFLLAFFCLAGFSSTHAIDAYLVAGQSNGWRLSHLEPMPGVAEPESGAKIHSFGMKCVSEPDFSSLITIHTSNPRAKGHGLATALLDRGEDIVFIQFCRCGASILGAHETSWWPGGDPANSDRFEGGLFGKLERYLEAARAQVKADLGEELKYRGIIWHQGESDQARDKVEYEAALRNVFWRLRDTLGNPNLPIVAGHIRDLGEGERGINAAIDRIARDQPYTLSVSLDPTLEFEPDRDGKPDVHIATAGCHALGREMAASLERLEAVPRAEIWIDRDRGDDANAGSKAEPLASLEAGLEKLAPGMTLNLVPGTSPWPSDLRFTVHGTPEAPIVIDGHGSLVSGRAILPLSEWSDEGNGIFSRSLPNNAWGMERFWEGGFPLVWFAGEPGINVESQTDLSPGRYFFHKNRAEATTDPLHNTLFIYPPSSEVEIETIVGEGGIYVGGNYVTVRNFITEYGGRDGYATHRNVGVIFENVEARYFMDQGISHHGAEVLVRHSHFHHNAGAGIVDVYPEVRVRYENCLIEANTWRGGVELHDGVFEFVNCVIRQNPGNAVVVTKGARAVFRNCEISGSAESARGVNLGDGSHLRLIQCRVSGFETGLGATITADTQLHVERSHFSNCLTNLRLSDRRSAESEPFNFRESMTFLDNSFDPAPVHLRTMRQSEINGPWDVRESTIDVTEFVQPFSDPS